MRWVESKYVRMPVTVNNLEHMYICMYVDMQVRISKRSVSQYLGDSSAIV